LCVHQAIKLCQARADPQLSAVTSLLASPLCWNQPNTHKKCPAATGAKTAKTAKCRSIGANSQKY